MCLRCFLPFLLTYLLVTKELIRRLDSRYSRCDLELLYAIKILLKSGTKKQAILLVPRHRSMDNYI